MKKILYKYTGWNGTSRVSAYSYLKFNAFIKKHDIFPAGTIVKGQAYKEINFKIKRDL